ncbi:MAG: TusE/DsrC/DsvC family sulfur relay protein [Betaproteobacteria bacterium]|nr:MAG: TusE/DsrC/DsvC family sulfur relay protein [Betaproteobacteria bacterium]
MSSHCLDCDDRAPWSQVRQRGRTELTDGYWPILHFMRDYWREHQVTPDVRHVIGFLASNQGMDKKVAKDQLFELFPYGYVQQACKIAGMIKPRAWSTG